MAEPYVRRLMVAVEEGAARRGINTGLFWHWLGNVKFAADDGNLTPERADQITEEIDELMDGFSMEEHDGR